MKKNLLFLNVLLALFVLLLAGNLAFSQSIDSSVLNQQVKQVLLTERFSPLAKVNDLPEDVRKEFARLGGGSLSMADPGAPYQEGCVVSPPPLPQRRLAFGGLSPGYCLIQYERGGKVHYFSLVLFQVKAHVGAKLIWAGSLSDRNLRLSDVEQLRSAVMSKSVNSYDPSARLP